MRPRFQADADFNQKIVAGVRRRESAIDFRSARDGGVIGRPDPEVLAQAASDDRCSSHTTGKPCRGTSGASLKPAPARASSSSHLTRNRYRTGDRGVAAGLGGIRGRRVGEHGCLPSAVIRKRSGEGWLPTIRAELRQGSISHGVSSCPTVQSSALLAPMNVCAAT